ncbi:YceI family protein [Candidatus Uhrbacteria bacterium]|nr:MAG: YceI family protein [Candidatus Uhrbacteria bacterium]
MKKSLIAIISVLVLIIGGFITYNALTAPTKAPSTLPTVTDERPAPTPSVEPATPTAVVPTGTYRIIPESSKATYSIFEMLRGKPVTVIGATSEVMGTFEVDRTDLSKASIGEIRVNARTFKTDDEKRDNATRRMILKTEDDANEFIIFKPITITTDKQSIDLNAEFAFRITGDLTISGTTKPAIWEGVGKFTSDTELSATVKTTVKRSDYSLVIPDFPFLADVADEVPLQIDFVAKK